MPHLSEIMVNDCKYVNGDLLVIEVIDVDNIIVGIVQTILIKNDKVYFVVLRYDASRNFLQYFESKQSDDPVSTYVKSDDLADFKPLIKRGSISRFEFVLHHRISFDYK